VPLKDRSAVELEAMPGRRPRTRSSQCSGQILLGQAEAKPVVKQSPVLFESAHGRVKAIEQALHQQCQGTALCGYRPWDGRLTRNPRGNVRAQLVGTTQESPKQRLRDRMACGVRTRLPHRLQKGMAGCERLEKDS
jgi:hypothetical protein